MLTIRDTLSALAVLVVITHMLLIVPGDLFTVAGALLVALLWLLWHPTYAYVGKNRYMLGRINAFALFAWTAALVLVFDVHVFLFGGNILLTLPIWLMLVVIAEWVGYHMLNIRIDAQNPGLFGFDVMHGSRTLKVFYLGAAPAFAFAMERISLLL